MWRMVNLLGGGHHDLESLGRSIRAMINRALGDRAPGLSFAEAYR